MTRMHAPRRTAMLLALAVALAWTVAPSAGRQAGQGPAPGWGVRFADTVLATWPDPASIDPAKNGWEYNTGIVLFGMSKMYDATKDPRYLAYIKRWVDGYVNDQGVLGWDQSRTHNLDYIQPGMLVLFLYEQTGDPRYRAAAQTVREAFDRIPKNADGGFWHKSQYPNEMWIDGIYMGEPFLVNYGRLFDQAVFGNDMAVFQSSLAAKHCLDPKTGLLYHAWDQDRNAAWADSTSGRSPIIWGRGMGWFVMAMVDILEQLPPSHPGYPSLHELLKKNVAGLARVQDPKTGLWFQVLDQGAGLAGNWIETSSSGMFVYAIRKAVRLKLVEPSYLPVAERAWKGLQATFEQDAAGRPVFTGAVQGMGVQTDAAGYLKVPRLKNSTHGLMAVMIAASEMEPGRGTPAVFRDWPAGCVAGGNRPPRRRELRGAAVPAPDGVHHLSRSVHVVRRADAREPHGRHRPAAAPGPQVRSALHTGRVEEHLAQRARRLPGIWHRAAGDLHPDERRALPRSRPQLRRQAVGDDDAGWHYLRGALLDRRHVHDHRRAGAGVPRHR